MTAINDKRLEVFAMARTPMTLPAKRCALAKAIRADIPARTVRCFYARVFWFVCALSFVATRFDLLGYRRRIFAYDFPYLRKPMAL